MEIERKFLVSTLPDLKNLEAKRIEQGYINTDPVLRIRRMNDDYFFTFKSKGLLAREEFERPLSLEQYNTLKPKTMYNIIKKTRYIIPFSANEHPIELDIFEGKLKGLFIAEVEFDSLNEANTFSPPNWFGDEVTQDSRYHNSNLCQLDDLSSL